MQSAAKYTALYSGLGVNYMISTCSPHDGAGA